MGKARRSTQKLEALINDQGERPLLMKELLAALSCEGGKKHLHALKNALFQSRRSGSVYTTDKTSATLNKSGCMETSRSTKIMTVSIY